MKQVIAMPVALKCTLYDFWFWKNTSFIALHCFLKGEIKCESIYRPLVRQYTVCNWGIKGNEPFLNLYCFAVVTPTNHNFVLSQIFQQFSKACMHFSFMQILEMCLKHKIASFLFIQNSQALNMKYFYHLCVFFFFFFFLIFSVFFFFRNGSTQSLTLTQTACQRTPLQFCRMKHKRGHLLAAAAQRG